MRKKAAISLVDPAQMAEVDRSAIASGLDGYRLMEAAGAAIAAVALREYPHATRAVVLCGPGNNGGDGYVAARYLLKTGMPVFLHSLSDPSRLHGDAALARDDWTGSINDLKDIDLSDGTIVIDALFGGGLDRPISGQAADVVAAVLESGRPVISADLPSGISGRSGAMLGCALKADWTVTFVSPKPGHLLMPGRARCGHLEIVDIGIPDRFVERLDTPLWINGPATWRHSVPHPRESDHKYSRGHLCVFSGSYSRTGAARLAAMSALRVGAGLVTILASGGASAANVAHLTAIMVQRVDDGPDLEVILKDKRHNAFVLGPAFGVGERACDFARQITATGRTLVLDADGLTSFAGKTEQLCDCCKDAPVLMTPHHGEFARLFPDLVADSALSKVDRARGAAQLTGAVVLYKGADTVIASPDGRAVINDNAPPWLATAGSGDCLAGIAGALLAQGMPVFEAAALAAYMHGEAGQQAGEGMTAEQIAGALPPLSHLRTP